MVDKCEEVMKWRIRRETRKAKSSNKKTRKAAKTALLAYKKTKSMFINWCKEDKDYKIYKSEEEFNKKMDALEKAAEKMVKAMKKKGQL